jgi:hypothetical protein
MTNTTFDRPRRVRSTLARALLILPLGLALSGHATQAQTTAPSCGAALSSLMSEWRSIGFEEPGKPGQMIVAGRHGYQTTGGQYNFMVQQIRIGTRDYEAGRDAEALQHFKTVREILEHTHI